MENYIDGTVKFNSVMEAKTVADYVVARLADLGIQHSFGLPGDFAFNLNHAVCNNSLLSWVECTNELNAAYAADGYARITGAAILSTTFAVGELSALNGVMGSKAENVLVFHLVGMPARASWSSDKILHHTLADKEYMLFSKLSAAACCVSSIITPQNCVSEMDRVISKAFSKRQPAYIAIAMDDALLPITPQAEELKSHITFLKSNPTQLQNALKVIREALHAAKDLIVLPGYNLSRYNLADQALKLIKKLNCPFITMIMDKGVFDEATSNYFGMYSGAKTEPHILELINNADLVLNLGEAIFSDMNTLKFSHAINPQKILTATPNFIRFKDQIFNHVYIEDVINNLLSSNLPNYSFDKKPYDIHFIEETAEERLDIDKLFYLINKYVLKSNDIVLIETGSSSIAASKLCLKPGTQFHSPILWGSIGWATPAAFGAAIAAPQHRVVLITGEGSHQVTINSVLEMVRYEIKPFIIIINNHGFTIERGLDKDITWEFNDIAQVNYTQLISTLSNNKWFTATVKTNQEFIAASQQATQADKAVYIEVILDKYDFTDHLQFIHDELS